MKDNFLCDKNSILLIKNESGKVLFGIKAIKNTNFYDKLINKFNNIFSDLEEIRINKAEFNNKKNKGCIDILINTGGGMMPWQYLKYKIEHIDII